MLPIQPAQGRVPAPRPAQPPQDPGRRRRGRRSSGSQNLIEPGYNKPKNHERGPRVGRADGPGRRARRSARSTPSSPPTGTPRPTRSAGRGARRRPRRRAGRRRDRPGDPERAGLRRPRTTCALFTTLIYSAQRRLSLTSPYFVPDESLLYAVTTAAQRGVDVELFVSEEGDQFMVYHAQCSYYRGAARGRACGSTSTRRRTSCTPSTSPSTTTSP